MTYDIEAWAARVDAEGIQPTLSLYCCPHHTDNDDVPCLGWSDDERAADLVNAHGLRGALDPHGYDTMSADQLRAMGVPA